MCCYEDEDENGNRFMRLQVSDKKVLSKAPVGTRITMNVTGEVVEVEAPKMVRDYSMPYESIPKGKKRPMKERPGVIRLKLGKTAPGISFVDKMLASEDAD